MQTYVFDLPLQKVTNIDGAFVVIPLNLPQVFGMGRMKVHATFDGVAYDGSIVSMGSADDGSKQYILGVRKDIRAQISKQPGDIVHVTFINNQLPGSAWNYYKMLIAKVEGKGRTHSELTEVTHWLLGYDPEFLTEEVLSNVSYTDWLDAAPTLNPLSDHMKGKICGFDITTITDATMRRMRLLDKLVDDLAKGKPLEKICPKD